MDHESKRTTAVHCSLTWTSYCCCCWCLASAQCTKPPLQLQQQQQPQRQLLLQWLTVPQPQPFGAPVLLHSSCRKYLTLHQPLTCSSTADSYVKFLCSAFSAALKSNCCAVCAMHLWFVFHANAVQC
jgi:hypothetical protein